MAPCGAVAAAPYFAAILVFLALMSAVCAMTRAVSVLSATTCGSVLAACASVVSDASATAAAAANRIHLFDFAIHLLLTRKPIQQAHGTGMTPGRHPRCNPRSEERRVGKECVSRGKSWGSPEH